MKYYNPSKINKKKATYNIIFGERSNGKTYALLHQSLLDYIKNKKQMAYVRRWREDITGRRASSLFEGINANDVVRSLTKNEYHGVHYYGGKWFLCTYNEKGKAIYNDADVIGFAFALSSGEHDKSTSYPNINTIIFDEFLTSNTYLQDEFVSFMNTVSTIIRKRDDVLIYMLGNTVNKYCPYFSEMGLTNIKEMKQGSIDVYSYGSSGLTVAVEYCSSVVNKTEVNKYFAFNNPKLEMITSGAWELNLYPHLQVKYKPENILLTFYIKFSDNIYQCEVIDVDNSPFIFIHDKTTPIKNECDFIIYDIEPNYNMNYNSNLLNPMNKTQSRILWFFKHNRVFYQDNNVGDAINNFLKICKRA